MKTQIIADIDRLYFDLDQLDQDQFWHRVDGLFGDSRDVARAIDYFLTHLADNHSIPGNVWFKLTGIADWIRSGRPLTSTQERFVIMSFLEYWDQRDLMSFNYA